MCFKDNLLLTCKFHSVHIYENVLHINQFETEFKTEQWTHKFNTLSMISLIRVLEHDTETGNTVMMFETCSYININSNTFLCFLSQNYSVSNFPSYS